MREVTRDLTDRKAVDSIGLVMPNQHINTRETFRWNFLKLPATSHSPLIPIPYPLSPNFTNIYLKLPKKWGSS